MRSVFYGTVLVCLLASLLAFATAPAVALASNQLMQLTAETVQDKSPGVNSGDKGFSGEAKAGASSPSTSDSLANCQRAMLGEYCALPEWSMRFESSKKDRYSPDMKN